MNRNIKWVFISKIKNETLNMFELKYMSIIHISQNVYIARASVGSIRFVFTIIFQFLENVFRFWDLKGENHAFSLSSWIEYFYDGNFPDIAQWPKNVLILFSFTELGQRRNSSHSSSGNTSRIFTRSQCLSVVSLFLADNA